MDKGRSPLDLVDPATGKALHLALVDDEGRVTECGKALQVVNV